MTKKITVKRQSDSNPLKTWSVYLGSSNIGYVKMLQDGDHSCRLTTASEAHYNEALELISNELAEEILMETT